MSSRASLWLGLFGLLLSGCGCAPRSGLTASPPSRTPSIGTGSEPSAEPAPHPPLDGSGEFRPPFEPGSIASIPKPGAQGWKPAESDLASLGTKMDKAMSELKGAWAEADTMLEVKGAMLNGKSHIKVQDSDTFSVQYYTPENQATVFRLISNGAKRSLYDGSEWRKLPPASQDRGGSLDPEDVKDWPKEFTETMFANFVDGRNVWGPLLRSWDDGDGDAKAKMEKKTVRINNADRQIYRVYATRADGAEMEIVVDGIRFLPLTVRSVVPRAEGKKDSMLWTGRWKFGGKHTAKDFVIPR